jgi:hypothetical protein
MPAVTSILPYLPFAEPRSFPAPVAGRYTLDGDGALEARLGALCEEVDRGIMRVVPAHRVEGILLGGGYGRGEGGVLRTAGGDRPYNDMEFYVLLRGNTVLNEWRHRAVLRQLEHHLSETAGIEVEFKILSVADLRRRPVTMFSYDLVQGNRCIRGRPDLLRGCEHHLRAEDIPLEEATRLLFNRCSGLLFARDRLDRVKFTAEDADFVGRNLAKVRLALGDVVLTAARQYHWSCRERHRRLGELPAPGGIPCLATIRAEHAEGLAFKLHPERTDASPGELREELRALSQLACRLWLWVESRRLGAGFRTPGGYALHAPAKCPGTSPLRNWLVTARHLGWRELVSPAAFRYPRERLLRALPVLLWQPTLLANSRVRARLQHDLRTTATDEAGLLAAYTRLWEIFR